MNDEQDQEPKRPNLLSRFDGFIKKFIPNFNARAILYFSLLFAVAMYVQIWRISSHSQKPLSSPNDKQETVIADDSYWTSEGYKQRIQQQTVESFTGELKSWLNGESQEFTRRRFEDILFINGGLTPLTGGDLASVVPESFNYLENHAKTRYQYSKDKGFMSPTPTLIKHGELVCAISDRTEKQTGIELYEWRYAFMPRLAEFMVSKPDWKMQIGDRILDISDPRIEDKDLLKLKNSQNQPAGLFSFLIFRDSKSNRIYLADSTILEKNGVDARLTLGNLNSKREHPKLYFQYGYESCEHINEVPEIDYGHVD